MSALCPAAGAVRVYGWRSASLNGSRRIWPQRRHHDYSLAGYRAGNTGKYPESVVLREGTDYGEHEKSLSDKVADLYTQLKNGDIVIVWSELHETLNIMPSAQFRG